MLGIADIHYISTHAMHSHAAGSLLSSALIHNLNTYCVWWALCQHKRCKVRWRCSRGLTQLVLIYIPCTCRAVQYRYLRERVSPPHLSGFEGLIDSLLFALRAVLSPSAALHHPGKLHLLVPRARQHVVGLAVLVHHHTGHLKRGSRGVRLRRDWPQVVGLEERRYWPHRMWCEKFHAMMFSHLPGHISGEVAVRSKLQVAAVSSGVVHYVYLTRLGRQKQKDRLEEIKQISLNFHLETDVPDNID